MPLGDGWEPEMMVIGMLGVLADSSGSSASTTEGIVFFVALIACCVGYQAFLRNGMRPRTVVTSLDRASVEQIFEHKVAGMGWHLKRDGSHLVAESSLVTGILRQRIRLEVGTDDRYPGRLVARATVICYTKKVFGGPTKAHTLRFRLDAFTNAVRKADPGAIVVERKTSGGRRPATSPASGAPLGFPSPSATSVAAPTRTITPIGGGGGVPPLPIASVSSGAVAAMLPAVAPAGAALRLRGSLFSGAACAGCGSRPNVGARFCPGCGAPVSSTSRSAMAVAQPSR